MLMQAAVEAAVLTLALGAAVLVVLLALAVTLVERPRSWRSRRACRRTSGAKRPSRT